MNLLRIVSKARKPRFELHLKIIDLNNVPLASGTSYVKWHLPTSTAAEHRGRTPKCTISDHKVCWDYSHTITLRLQMDKSNQLLETLIHFEVVQDYSSSGRPDKISLGQVKLNLAEYVDGAEGEGDSGEGGIVRRYLMQESKINSTLKIGISMKQLDGEKNYTAPVLKTAPVFQGIAGIMAGERVDPEELGDLPNSKPRTAEHGDLQDMYRRALAASWLSQPGELPPDQCVEDIFAGGTGWYQDDEFGGFPDSGNSSKVATPRRRHHFRNQSTGNTYGSGTDDEGDSIAEKRGWHSRMPSNGSGRSRMTHRKDKPQNGSKHVRNGSAATNATGKYSNMSHPGVEPRSPRCVVSPMEHPDIDARGRTGFKHADEVDEFDARDDLIAWRLPGEVN